MRWFISLPMNGRDDEEVKRELNECRQRILTVDEQAEFLDTFIEEAPEDAKGLWYLGKSLEIMDGADACYFCRGWENARGCSLEHYSAKEYGKKIFYE